MKKYLLLVLVVLATGCSDDPPVDWVSDGERKSVLEAIADNVIIPGFNELATSAAALESTVNALAASPNETSLEAAQAAWITMARQWKRIEYMQQGLLDQEREDSLIFKIDLGAADHTMRNATIDQAALEEAVLTFDDIDIAYVERLPAKIQGIYAIEDLLFRTDDATALANLTVNNNATKRRELLKALTASLRARFEMLKVSWGSGANFRQQFINQFGTDLGSSLGMLMNDIVYLAEQMKNQKIGRPVGYLSAQIPQPDSVEARWSVQSLPFFIENLNGIEQAFTSDADGRAGIGIDSLLNFMDAKVGESDVNLSEAVITQLNTMRALAQSLGNDLPNAVRTNRKVDELFTECLVLLKLLKVDVVSQLGVMITTLEGDGD